MADFIEQNLAGSRFRKVDLTDAQFELVDLHGAEIRKSQLTGTRFRGASFENVVMRGVEMVNVEISGMIQNVSVNGVDIGPLLDSVSEEQARAHPISDAHSIIELVAHMSTWMDAVAHRLIGDTRELTTEEDWRDVTQLPWPTAIDELENAHSRLSDVIARLTVDDLDKIVAGRKYNVYVMLHGVIQHNLYHSGQIAILKKALLSQNSTHP